VVRPDHSTYKHVAYALAQQDHWPREGHGDFWTALLPELPRPVGRPSDAEALSRAAAALRTFAGYGDAEIAKALSVAPGTVRQRDPDRDPDYHGRPRPSFERGARVVDDPADYGHTLRRYAGTVWIPEEELPRVWRPGVDDEPSPDAGLSPHVIPPSELEVPEHERLPGGGPWIGGDEYRALAEAEWRRVGHPASPGARNAPECAQTGRIRGGAKRR